MQAKQFINSRFILRIAISISFIFQIIFYYPARTQNIHHPNFHPVEDGPEYYGGFPPDGYLSWMTYLKNNFKVPAQTSLKSGNKIEATFKVTPEGKIENPKITKGLDAACNKEVLRVIRKMPQWRPLFDYRNNPITPTVHLYVNLIADNANKTHPILAIFDTDLKGGNDFLLLRNIQNAGFKGGNEAMVKFIRDNIHYPRQSMNSRITGTVYIQLNVEKTGKISNIHVLRGLGPDFDNEAIRIVRLMPDFVPAKSFFGESQLSMFQLGVKFELSKE